jgi:hypothetical protein
MTLLRYLIVSTCCLPEGSSSSSERYKGPSALQPHLHVTALQGFPASKVVLYEIMLTSEDTRAEVFPENLWYAKEVDEAVRARLGQRRDGLVAELARLFIGALQCHTFSNVGRREFEVSENEANALVIELEYLSLRNEILVA